MRREIIIGTRKSGLAMWQAQWVCRRLQELFPEHRFIIRGMKTTGDNILDVALAKIGDKGLFTKELELALQKEEIDLAVHSMKDVPTSLPPGLVIGAVCEREYPGDVLVATEKISLEQLPRGAKIGTSSLRRRAQLLHHRPDLSVVNIRGNINTRMRKLEEQNLDAIVLAFAGVYRMGWEKMIAEKIPFSVLLPAVGQGSLGVEIREDDAEISAIVAQLDHTKSRLAITAERELMKTLEGGCQIPIGALAEINGDRMRLEAVVADLEGREYVRSYTKGRAADAASLGRKLARQLLDTGAGSILDKIKRENDANG